MRTIQVNGFTVDIHSYDAIIIGSGCAGFNAADTLYTLGVRNIALLTEGIKMGTSRNTGSDKQTYYKLSMSGDARDSIDELAENLFSGGSVHGDTALSEAAGSVRAFMKLVSLGVPFPCNRYGEYVGYKTDHDPKQRATSCGPLTSKLMTEHLEDSVKAKNIQIFDEMTVVRLFKDENGITAAAAVRTGSQEKRIAVFVSGNIIVATGGPSALYSSSVFPESQTGMSSLSLEAGAKGCNMQEWQYGLASTKFRWNLSGTYQQVLPKYISIDKDGVEREFLYDYIPSTEKILECVFLKGYQWPFDAAKLGNGSSIIDVLVHNEIVNLGRRVFLDYRSEPKDLDLDKLPEVAHDYLARSNALIDLPIKRLQFMNPKAYDLYLSHGIDLETEMLEISVCAQHNNGGIAVDSDWQTCVPGLFVAGEAAGTFGVTRPGGSALNSTQVGSLRAAEYISLNKREVCEDAVMDQIDALCADCEAILAGGDKNARAIVRENGVKMSSFASHIRDTAKMAELRNEIASMIPTFFDKVSISSREGLSDAFKARDALITSSAVLSAMLISADQFGSRGSAIVLDENGTVPSYSPEYYTFKAENTDGRKYVTTTELTSDGFKSYTEPVRPMPESGGWFENVWREYNERFGVK